MPLGQIFQGVTTSPARDFVANTILQTKKKKVYMPCAGRFGSSQAYIEYGGDKKSFYTSDISLFSSVLGYLADDNKKIEDLGIKFNGEIKPRSDDELEIAATVMLNIKYAQIKANTKYGMNIRKEIMSDVGKYIDGLKDKITTFLNSMQGINYDIKDLWEVLEEVKDDEDACIFLNVPTYKGGYTKMFSDLEVSWNEPDVPEFDPKTYEKMIAMLTDAKCYALVYAQKTLEKIPLGWYTVFAQAYGLDRTDYIVSNRELNSSYAVSDTRYNKPKIYEIYDDSDITEDTK